MPRVETLRYVGPGAGRRIAAPLAMEEDFEEEVHDSSQEPSDELFVDTAQSAAEQLNFEKRDQATPYEPNVYERPDEEHSVDEETHPSANVDMDATSEVSCHEESLLTETPAIAEDHSVTGENDAPVSPDEDKGSLDDTLTPTIPTDVVPQPLGEKTVPCTVVLNPL